MEEMTVEMERRQRVQKDVKRLIERAKLILEKRMGGRDKPRTDIGLNPASRNVVHKF